MRYSEDTKDEEFDNTIVITSGATSDTHVDWKAGIDFRVTDDCMVYASAATGYRPQAFNPRPFQITQFVPVDGEEATSYELGIKSELFDRRLRINLAGFYIDYNQRILPVGGSECLAGPTGNYLFIVPPGTPGAVQDSLGQFCIDANGPPPPGATVSRTFYTNIPAEVAGAELELQWQPVDGLTISGIYGYTDFQGDELDNPGLLGPNITEIFADYPIYVPEDNWSVSDGLCIRRREWQHADTAHRRVRSERDMPDGAEQRERCSDGHHDRGGLHGRLRDHECPHRVEQP